MTRINAALELARMRAVLETLQDLRIGEARLRDLFGDASAAVADG
jgi:hypothetical protein